MRVSKAKRRWMKWQRYVNRTKTKSTHKYLAGNHRGMVWAYDDAMFANRYVPKGARDVWLIRFPKKKGNRNE